MILPASCPYAFAIDCSPPRKYTVVTTPDELTLAGSPRTTAMLPGKDCWSNLKENVVLSPALRDVSSPLATTLLPDGTVIFRSAEYRSAVYPLTGNQRAGYIRYA